MNDNMTAKTNVIMHQIDSDTLAEISRAHDDLIRCVDWFLNRDDLVAVERLMPIVESIGNRLMAIYEGSYPEITPCIEAINQFGDEMVQRFIHASTSDERKILFNYLTESIARRNQSPETLKEIAPTKRFAA